MSGHPSGRPIRDRVIKTPAQPRGTYEGFLTARLNRETRMIVELPGGFGFARPPEPEDPMWHETRAQKRPN